METKRRKLKPDQASKLRNGTSIGSIITAEVDTLSPISSIQRIIGKRLRTKDLSNHDIFLQDFQLEPTLSLYDQGVKVDGKVELSVQVETQGGSGKLTIVEIAKNMTDDEMQVLMTEPNEAAVMKADVAPPMENGIKESETDKEELGIPCDPTLWTADQVHRWMVWVAREFGLDTSVTKNLGIDGKQLSSMTIEEFFIKIPYGNILWSHLSLLKKISNPDASEIVQTSSDGDEALNLVTNSKKSVQPEPTSIISGIKHQTSKVARSPKKVVTNEKTLAGNRSGNNGQIQLWQFLLELLTDADERDVIAWQGHEGEFKLLHPEKVAQKWGERKNKPAMNYEKLSRALRYYYDGDMISKVQGKRFVYKFVCNLREILGYDAADLSRLVTECEMKRRESRGQMQVHLTLMNNGNTTNNITIHNVVR